MIEGVFGVIRATASCDGTLMIVLSSGGPFKSTNLLQLYTMGWRASETPSQNHQLLLGSERLVLLTFDLRRCKAARNRIPVGFLHPPMGLGIGYRQHDSSMFLDSNVYADSVCPVLAHRETPAPSALPATGPQLRLYQCHHIVHNFLSESFHPSSITSVSSGPSRYLANARTCSRMLGR